MSYVTGSHNVGAGIHFRLARRADDHFINNSMTLGFRGNVPAEVTLWASPFRNEVRQRVVGLYAQAIRWDPGRREHPELPHRAALVQGSEHQGFRSGMMPLPWDFRVSAVWQSLPAIPTNADFVLPPGAARAELGRNQTGGAPFRTIQLVTPSSFYVEPRAHRLSGEPALPGGRVPHRTAVQRLQSDERERPLADHDPGSDADWRR